jgi:MarR family transcriptional regulator, lower aerobic nicotinate degradation pathway regulator
MAVVKFLDETSKFRTTPVQFAVLVVAEAYPLSDIQTLGELAAIDRSALGTVLGKLKRAKLVDVVSDPQDKRARLTRITPRGEALLRDMRRHVETAQDRILEPLTAVEREAFMAHLRRLTHLNHAFSRVPAKPHSDDISLYDKPGHLIRRLQQISIGIFYKFVTLDITPLQYACLEGVFSYPDVDNSRLAQLVNLDRPTLGSIVKRMEAKGWLEIRADPQDKRANCLNLTERGRQVLFDTRPLVDTADRELVQPLSRTDRERFLDRVARLTLDRPPGN